MSEPADRDVLAEEVRCALQRLLASQELSRSPRLKRFLSCVVEETLAGRQGAIKEYSVAVAAYDRDSAFESRADNIVRMEARRLRRQLAVYYHGPGSRDPVIFELPRGTYAPVFRRRDATAVAEASAAQGAHAGLRTRWARWAGGLGAVLLVVAGVAWWLSGLFAASLAPDRWVLAGSELKVLIADIDGDGRREVLFNFFPEDPRDGAGSLICFEQDGRRRWEYRYGESKTFGSRTFEVRYRGMLIRPVRISGRPFLVATANHNVWYPAQVSLLDVATGRRLEQYWPSGLDLPVRPG